MLVLGIDPGKSGGVAVMSITSDSFRVIDVQPVPETYVHIRDFLKLLSQHKEKGERVVVYIEDVTEAFHWCLKDAPHKIHNNLKLLLHYERILCACQQNRFDTQPILPHVWQSLYAFGRTVKEKYDARKRRLKETAAGINDLLSAPLKKITLKTADAFLIALWGCQHHNKKIVTRIVSAWYRQGSPETLALG